MSRCVSLLAVALVALVACSSVVQAVDLEGLDLPDGMEVSDVQVREMPPRPTVGVTGTFGQPDYFEEQWATQLFYRRMHGGGSKVRGAPAHATHAAPLRGCRGC